MSIHIVVVIIVCYRPSTESWQFSRYYYIGIIVSSKCHQTVKIIDKTTLLSSQC